MTEFLRIDLLLLNDCGVEGWSLLSAAAMKRYGCNLWFLWEAESDQFVAKRTREEASTSGGNDYQFLTF